jgi:predicted RNase H-like HicB family nuclease
MNFEIEFEQETDGRWIAEIPEIPGVLAYGVTPLQAGAKAKALALRVLADRMENETSIPAINTIAFASRHEPVAVN